MNSQNINICQYYYLHFPVIALLANMKRKLDANDVPSPEVAEGDNEKKGDFEKLNLDPRLRQALIKEKFTKPTLVQSEAIPLALEGKDILGEFWKCQIIVQLIGY